MQIFARITKVDEAARSVSGVIANEALDRSGEVFDYVSSKPHFEKWSTDIAKATDGKSVGNVRAMHGNVAAGKLSALHMDDVEKSIAVDAKIVDDNEWAKVQQGVYTGFSIGGKYAKQWTDGDVRRYTAQPYEVSLVDLPCNPDAQFTVIKADGSEELRKFETAKTDATDPVTELAKTLSEDGRGALEDALGKMQGEASADDVHATLDACEDETDDDDDASLNALDDARDALGTDEEIAKGDYPGHPFRGNQYASGSGGGARHRAAFRAHTATKATLGSGSSKASHTHAASKHDRAARSAKRAGAERQASYHQHMASYHTSRANRFKKDAGGDMHKIADALQKLTAERDGLAKSLADTQAQLDVLKAQPAPAKGVVRIVEKTSDNGTSAQAVPDESPVLKADGSTDHLATAQKLMKVAFTRPMAANR